MNNGVARQEALSHLIVGALLAVPIELLAAPAASAKSPEYFIPFVDRGGIRNWQADGSQGLWILASGGRWYYASFSSPCHELPFASGIQFIPEPAGDLSRWSSIRLSQAERCFFRSLQPSSRPPKKDPPPTPTDGAEKSLKGAPTRAASNLTTAIVMERQPKRLDLALPRIDQLLTPAQLQAAITSKPDATHETEGEGESEGEQGDTDSAATVVVQASTSKEWTPPDTLPAPCRLANIAWSLAHPAAAWRVVAPVPPESNTAACAAAATAAVAVPSMAALSNPRGPA